MKSFLKYVLATIVGILIANFVVLILFLLFIGTILTLSNQNVNVKENSLLTIRLDNTLTDRTSNNPLENIDLFSMTARPNLGLNKILASIRHAAQDNRIKGIYLNLTDIQGSFGALATTEEIRNALKEFKKSGKFIYSYSNLGYSQKAYYLASIADKIFVNPETPLLLSGMSSSVTFYKEALDKLGIQAEIVKVGKFKSAVEPFIATEMSAANRQQIKRYLNSSWESITTAIAESRDIPVDTINALADRFDFYTTKTLKEMGFFDGIVYEDEMIDILKEKCGVEHEDKLNSITLTDYQNLPEINQQQDFSDNKIAVIYAQGEIGLEQSNSSIGPELANTIREARKNKNIKAIVMRVNSPGGSALTSDIIWREVCLARQSKPVIVSMGDVAASGGYYISCAADTIVAEPTTLTGSIGIFGMFFTGEKLIKEKLGIHTDVVNTNQHSDFGGSYPLPIPISSRSLTEYERNVLQRYVNQGYATFIDRVMQGRNLEYNHLDSIAQGRVWTGKDALSIGLIDVLGGLEDAIHIAAAKANIEKYELVEYPRIKDPVEELFSQLTGNIRARIIQEELGAYYDIHEEIKTLTENQGILARLPFHLSTFN